MINNIPTELIFIVDTCAKSEKSKESIKYFISSVIKGVIGDVRLHLFHYNDLAFYDIIGLTDCKKFSYPDFSFEGEPQFRQALKAISACHINWSENSRHPIIIWLTSTNPIDDFSNLLKDLKNNDILFNAAFNIAVKFGLSESDHIVKDFVGSNGLRCSSLEIDTVVDFINTRIGRPIKNNNGEIDRLTDILLRQKIEDLYIVESSPEIIINNKIHASSEVIFACNKNGKWGWMDINGKQLIPFLYNYVKNFSEGLAAVCTEGTPDEYFTSSMRCRTEGYWGFINTLGQKVIPEKYSKVSSFKNGLALVSINGKWGAINKEGDTIILCIYDGLNYIADDILKVEHKIKSKTSNIISSISKYGLISTSGLSIVKPKYDNISDFENGFALARTNDTYFLINRNGREIARIPYRSTRFTNNPNLLEICNKPRIKGICSLDGSIIIRPNYEKFIIGTNAILALNELSCDLFDLKGQKINRFELVRGFLYKDRAYAKRKDDNRWIVIKPNGDINELPYKEIYLIFDNGNMLVNDYLEHDTSEYLSWCLLVQPNGTLLSRYNLFKSPKTIVKSQSFIKIEGKESLWYSSLTWVHLFNRFNGICFYVCNNYDTGTHFKDYDNLVVIPVKYPSVHFQGINITEHYVYRLVDINTGKTVGEQKDNQGHINYPTFSYLGQLSEGLIVFKQNDKWGYIDTSAKIVIQPIYDHCNPFKNGHAIVSIGEEYYLINKQGKRLNSMPFESLLDIEFL